MESGKSIILKPSAIEAKLNRIAWEIYEANAHNQELVIVGIDRRGSHVAKALVQRLQKISPLNIIEHTARGGKDTHIATIDAPEDGLKEKEVLIVDDVLYSGKTLFKTLEAVVALNPSRIQVAILIDRGHRSLPVSADFVGLELATTLKQYVSVEIEAESRKMTAFLF